VILGFDPGRDKCGVAVMADRLGDALGDGLGKQHHILDHQVVPAAEVIQMLQTQIQQFQVTCLVMGDQTTSKQWRTRLQQQLIPCPEIILVDERYTSLEARERYWQLYPPQGFLRLLPQGLRQPPRPIDDIVAILLIERYLQKTAR
jgi:RNase H-fold protein (predicted Holliday junction resolvase)